MWIFTQDAFLTISQDANDRAKFMIRARVRGDTEKLFPKARIIRTDDADFLYRCFIDKEHAVEVMSRAIAGITYTSFKSEIKDRCRKWFYERIWSITCDMQDVMR